MSDQAYRLEIFKKAEVVEKMVNVLMNAEAILCDPKFGPTYYYATELYQIPLGYTVSVNYIKLAEALYDHGFRLMKEGEEDDS